MAAPEDVETDLGWALFVIVRRYRQLTDDLLADLPGGPRGYWVLMASRHGGLHSQLALARHLGVDRTAMTYLLDDLEGAGLVERKPDPADRRARRIELTEQGTAVLSSARQRLRPAETALLAPLKPAERETLRALLPQLAANGELPETAVGPGGGKRTKPQGPGQPPDR